MKGHIKVAMLLCMVPVLLSALTLQTVEAKVTPPNGMAPQGHFGANAGGQRGVVASANRRGFGGFSAVAVVSANDIWAVGTGLSTLIEHWNGSKWSIVKSANPGGSFNNLFGVAAVSTNDVWAVGSESDSGRDVPSKTLIEHWNGTQWSVVSSPSPGAYSNRLAGVVAVSAKDVWAVGDYSPDGFSLPTLIEHWDGTVWSIVTSPSPNGIDFLNGVAAVSASDVWTVGYYFTNNNVSQTLIEHWNGTTWSVVTSPNPNPGAINNLQAVTAISANDIWTVGYYNNSSQVAQTLIEHWNGTQWSVVTSPNVGTSNNQLLGVAAVSASAVWTVGSYCTANCGASPTLVERWNGSKWSVVRSLSPGSLFNRLTGVAVVSASAVWAVGAYSNGSEQTLTEQWNGTKWSIVKSPSQNGGGHLTGVAAVSASNAWAVGSDVSGTLTEHWNGSKWSIVPSPSPGSFDKSLSGVAVAAASDVWAVGYYGNANGNYQTLTEQWNGSKWSVVTSPSPGPTFNNLLGVAVVSANDMWTVGNYTNGNGAEQTLIEHWNGHTWSVVNSPDPGSNDTLYGVTVVSTNDVWAVGTYNNSNGLGQTLIEHWNGSTWSVVASPSPGSFLNDLNGVTAVSASDVWSVGYNDGNSTIQTLTEHWNGSTWSVVASPNPGSGNSLSGVATASASDVWAAGSGSGGTVIEHWNGSQWSVVMSPNPGSIGNFLNGVAAVSANDALAVGVDTNNGYSSQTLIERWNGTKWSVAHSPNT